MIYSLLVTNPNDPSWSTIATVDSDTVDNAIVFLLEHNPGMAAVEYNPLADEKLITELTEQIINTIQNLLDNTAKSRGYDNMISLCTYANSSVSQFKLEGQAGVDFRDACWAKCYDIMGQVQAGLRSIPTTEQVLLELPQIVW